MKPNRAFLKKFRLKLFPDASKTSSTKSPTVSPPESPRSPEHETLGFWSEASPGMNKFITVPSWMNTRESLSPTRKATLSRISSTDMFLDSAVEDDNKGELEDEEHERHENIIDMEAGGVPTVVFSERWKEKEERIRQSSQHGHLPGWKLLPVIIKSCDDLRQEQFASQLIRQFHTIFEDSKLPVWIRPYDVIATSATSGVVEAIPDTISLDSLKRNDGQYTRLLDFFLRHYGGINSTAFRQARRNFVKSMAAYSIICYLLQIKDRHNGNLLLHAEGYLIHIDFGFILNNNPGNMHFEQAPFKLTEEFVELMGGPRSASFRHFRSLCVRSFLLARKHRHRISLLVEMMILGNADLPCFAGMPKGTMDALNERFHPEMNTRQCENFVHELIDMSLDNWRTRWYDKYQRWCVGVF